MLAPVQLRSSIEEDSRTDDFLTGRYLWKLITCLQKTGVSLKALLAMSFKTPVAVGERVNSLIKKYQIMEDSIVCIQIQQLLHLNIVNYSTVTNNFMT